MQSKKRIFINTENILQTMNEYIEYLFYDNRRVTLTMYKNIGRNYSIIGLTIKCKKTKHGCQQKREPMMWDACWGHKNQASTGTIWVVYMTNDRIYDTKIQRLIGMMKDVF